MGGLWGEERGHIRMWEAWGPQLPGEPHPEAGTSESCLPGLAARGAGGVHVRPVEAGRAPRLCPEQMNCGG